MINPICAASRELAVELMEADCPLDYPDAYPPSFHAEQLPGYVESWVCGLGPFDTGWVIPLRLRTDHPSGTIISHWDFEQPWQNHNIVWGELPESIFPKDHYVYKSLFSSRPMKVLNEGQLIQRRYPFEGVLCGRSYQPIGESSRGFISAKLTFTNDLGNTAPLCIDLNVHKHRYSIASGLPGGEALHRLFRHVDSGRRLDHSAIPAGPGSESVSLRCDAELRVPDLL